jgi:hypothetical protein
MRLSRLSRRRRAPVCDCRSRRARRTNSSATSTSARNHQQMCTSYRCQTSLCLPFVIGHRRHQSISVIELPRLKLRLQPQASADGTVRLCLLDHAGWFVRFDIIVVLCFVFCVSQLNGFAGSIASDCAATIRPGMRALDQLLVNRLFCTVLILL